MQKSNQTPSTFEHAPVSELVAEHDLIVKVLSAFETWAGSLSSKESDDRHGLQRFLRFFREYADGCHHIKEERFLFANMNRHGSSESKGPVEAMTGEHEESRKLISRLDVLAGQENPWTDEDRSEVESCVNAYVQLYRAHIEMENKVLYPLADKGLPNTAWNDISESFEGMQEEMECAGMVDELAELAQQLLN